MKKQISLCIAAILCLCLCACAQTASSGNTEQTAPSLVEHTLAPTAADEIEWCPVENCELRFEDENGTPYLTENDIERFAIVKEGEDASMVFVLTDDAVSMLSSMQVPDTLTVALNGKSVGTATFEENNTQLLLGGLSFEQLCEIADEIRGF